MVDPWQVLGIAPTDELRRIKQAYTGRLKRTHPEDDPEGFRELRQAYEIACAFAQWRHAHREGREPPRANSLPPAASRPTASRRSTLLPPSPSSSGFTARPDAAMWEAQWVEEAADQLAQQVRQLHSDPGTWTSEDAWRVLLQNPSLWNVDTKDAFQRRLVEILALQGATLSAGVWGILEEEFRWGEQRWSLYRMHPPNVVDRVMDCVDYLATIEAAERRWNDGLYHQAIAQLEPVAGSLRRELGLRARLLLGRCYMRTRAWGNAEAALGEVIRLDPSCVPAFLLLATLYRAEGRPRPAKDMYARVLELVPGHQDAAAGLALAEAEMQAPTRIPQPREDHPRRELHQTGEQAPSPWHYPLLMLLVLSAAARTFSTEDPGLRLLVLAGCGVLLLGVPVAIWLNWQGRKRTLIGLGLQYGPRPEQASPPSVGDPNTVDPGRRFAEESPQEARRRRLVGILVALAALLAILLIW